MQLSKSTVVMFLICLAVYLLGGLVTAPGVGDWYQAMAKPGITPPDWVFGPVWGVLFLMIAAAGSVAWASAGAGQKTAAFGLYGLQLALNLLWSALFFGAQQIGWALLEIGILWLVILANTISFWRIDRRAGLLLVPYLLWVGFAIVLNGLIWRLN